jgi:hypothetical protein
MNRLLKYKLGGYATNKKERSLGLLAGKHKFKFPYPAEQLMTMNPMGKSINTPVYYQGFTQGQLSDTGIAYPNQNFTVKGDEVREYPMYQLGGLVNTYMQNVSKVYDQGKQAVNNFNKGTEQFIIDNNIFGVRDHLQSHQQLHNQWKQLDEEAKKSAIELAEKYPDSEIAKDLLKKHGINNNTQMASKYKKGGSSKNKMYKSYQTGGSASLKPIETRNLLNPFDSRMNNGIYRYQLTPGSAVQTDNSQFKTITDYDNKMYGDKQMHLQPIGFNRKSSNTDLRKYALPVSKTPNYSANRFVLSDAESGKLDPYKLKVSDAPMASMAYNTLRFAQGKEKEPVQQNPFANQYLSGLKNLRYRPNYRPLKLSQNAAERTMRGSTYSVPQMIANMRNQNSAIQNKMIDTDLQAANINNQYRSRYLTALGDQGERVAAERRRANQINSQNNAQWWKFLAANASNFDSLMGNKRKLSNAKLARDTNLMGINLDNRDFKVVAQPDGTLKEYFRDPKTGVFKPVLQ